MILTGGRSSETSLCKVTATLIDSSRIDLEGDFIEFVFEDSLAISNNVFVQIVSDTVDWIRCDNFQATAIGGEADRKVSASIQQSEITCGTISWLGYGNSQTFVLSGAPSLNHPQAIVAATSIEFCPNLSTIIANGDERNLATIKRSNGQSTIASWIKYSYANQALDARNAIVEDRP